MRANTHKELKMERTEIDGERGREKERKREREK